MAVKIFNLIWAYFKINLQSIMQYKVGFLSQAGFMFLNDIAWVIFWMIFFHRFPQINNWGFNQMMMLYVLFPMVWGIAGIFFGNFTKIAESIKEGSLDFYLTLPKEELSHLLISRSKFSAYGEFIFSLVLAVFFIPLIKAPLFLILVLLSTIITLAFCIILGSLSFYISSSTEIARTGIMGMMSFAAYPFSVFKGYTRFLLLGIIPVGFIAGVPIDLLTNFSWSWLIAMFFVATIMLVLSIWIFKRGIKRYESGNLINIRI